MRSANSIRELVLMSNRGLMHLSLSDVANCYSFRKLSHLSCPLIIDLIIHHCPGWKKFEVRNLQKIRSLSFKINSELQLVKIQAPTLEHLSESLRVLKLLNYHKIGVIDAPNLESLEYEGYFNLLRSKLKNFIFYSCMCDLDVMWFCRLRKILSKTQNIIGKQYDYILDRSINICMKNSSHSTSHGSRPRLSQLKEVKAYIFDRENENWHPVQWRTQDFCSGGSKNKSINV
ncbi:hypothetical protein H5410_047444 [Solanum commersonii]|uniref:Uncharacterized protein n=1 Tax=Solanum commersonii TaxID=4109 RepID=A0A9J5XH40_SOLCO|nr:hypothetical protein H5410_047444 [Solanum commersonii]